MRSSRLLSLLLLLQARGPATAAGLAEALEVSERTIYRDVAALQAAGVPLWTEPGRGGGVRLLEGWTAELGALTADEAGTLFLGGAPGVVADLGLEALLAAAQTKLLATLPPELRGRADRVRQRFLLDAPGWFARPDEVPALPVVATALWRDRRLDLRAARSGGEVQRRVDPLGLVCKGGAWYLVAAHRGHVRTYRVSRLVSATVLDQPLHRPESFDLASWWAESSAAFDRSLLRSHVVVRCAGSDRRRLAEALGETAASLAEPVEQLGGAPAADGRVTLRVPVESSEVAAHQLLAVADRIELVDPPEARAALAERAHRIAARHRRS